MEAQIAQFIEQILQREPEPGEVDSWIALINDPSTDLDLDGVRDRIIDSAEAMDTVYPVIRAYQAVYGRVPDEGGLDFWVDHYRVLKDLDDPETETVNEGMVALLKPFVDPVQTEEFADRFGAHPNANQFVSACYTNVLNRAPDQGGQLYWEGVYNALHAQYEAANPGMSAAEINILTRAAILEQFVNSVEYKQSADPFIDTFLTGAADGSESYEGDLWDRAPYSLSVADAVVVEGDSGTKTVTLELVLDQAPSEDVTFTYTTGGGNATADDDYVPQTGTVTIKAGETTAQVTITIIGDTIPELNETFDVTFSSPLVTGGSATSTVTIFDDESTVVPLTPGIDILNGGPGNEVFLSSDNELGGNDRLDGGDGEDTLFHMINNSSTVVSEILLGQATGTTLAPFTVVDDLAGDAGNFLAAGTGVVWSGFRSDEIEVLAIQNNDELFGGFGEADDQETPYSADGEDGFIYGSAGQGLPWGFGGAAFVDVNGMNDLETVVFFQQNGVTGVRDLQPSHIAHDGVHVALIDVEGFHDSGEFGEGGPLPFNFPNGHQFLEQDNPWTCCDEEGLPRQIAATVDTFVDFDEEATKGSNSINVLLNEVVLGNLWFTQNLDNRNGELAEIEQLNLSLPGETELTGTEFDGIAGEPALINRIWASSTLETITVTGDDVTELASGESDDEYDLMLGIPILATTENWVGSGADAGHPWGLDVGLPGLTTFDASEFNGDLLLTLYNAVGMTITGGSGDDDFFINADDGEMGNLGWYTDDNGRLENTTIDGGEGFNVLWLPMSEADGDPNSPNGELGFDAVGPNNTLINIDKICFYGAIGEGSTPFGNNIQPLADVPWTLNAYELNVDYLGLADPSRTELVFDGSIGASTVIFDNFGDTVVDDAQIINVKFTDIGGWIDNGGGRIDPDDTFAPTLAFVPDEEVDPLDEIEDIVNVTFADDTRASTYVTITDDEYNGEPGVNIKGTDNDESNDEFDGDLTDDVDHEVDVLNIHLEDSDCGVANCLHVGIDSMVGLEEINITDDDYTRTVTPAMAAFFTYLTEITADGWEPGEWLWGGELPDGLSEEDAEYFEQLFGLSPFEYMNGNGVPLPANFAELQAGDTFVVEQSFAIGAVTGDGNDTPNLKLFNAGDSNANVDMWLNNAVEGDGYQAVGYEDGIGEDLYHLDFFVDPITNEGATIITGSGNDRVIDGAGNDTISTGEGCDLVMAVYGGNDTINSGGGDDLVVGGDGSDVIDGGAGNDMISGDSFGWLLAMLNEDRLDIASDTAAQFLDFFCCIESECFKDEFGPEERTPALLAMEAGHEGTTYTFLDGGNDDNGQNGGIPDDLYQYFLDQVDDNTALLDTDLPVTLDLCDIAEVLRTGELDLTPFSGSVTLEFDSHNEVVWDFILDILDEPMQSLGLLHLVGAGAGESLADVLADIADNVDNVLADFGNDVIHGNDGNDIIHGGSGDDLLYGDDGEDIVVGGDDDDLVDGGAGADVMVGGFYQVQPGIPAVAAVAVITAAGLHGEGDEYSVTVNGIEYTSVLDDGESINDVLADLAMQIDADTANNGVGGASYAGGELTVTGAPDGSNFNIIVGAFDGAPADFDVAEVSTVTIDDSEVYDLGDVIEIDIDGTPYSYTAQDGDTAEIIAQELADLINAGSQMSAAANNGVVTLTGNVPATDYTITATLTDVTTPSVVAYQVAPSGLDQAGESLTVTLDDSLVFPPSTQFSFAQAFNTDLETTLNDFVSSHRDDILDILDNGIDDGSDGLGTNDDVYVTDGKLFIYDEGNTLGFIGIDEVVTATVNGTGSATVLIDEGHDNGDPVVVDNGPTEEQDGTQALDLVYTPGDPGMPAGTDGSDIFVAQTDSVLANSWYSHAQGGEHTVNQIDHILDFWSSQSPAVNDEMDPDYQQERDYLGFRDADGNVVSFTGSFYEEQHNNANTYEDALENANAAMQNGVTKVVAISYNEGVDDNSDKFFDQDENFLVVFADTDNDNLADTAVRLIGRDNVLDDFHHQDVTSLFA